MVMKVRVIMIMDCLPSHLLALGKVVVLLIKSTSYGERMR